MALSYGLSTDEAKVLLEKNGRNELVHTSKKNPVFVFLSQFYSFLVLLLLLAAGVSFYFGEYLDAGFILVVVLLNGGLGFYQEFKADKAIERLRDMTVSMVRVVRDGKEVLIPSAEVVVGDAVLIEEGNKVPIDGMVIESMHLAVDESALTGESVAVEKKTLDKKTRGDRQKTMDTASEEQMVFMGTVVARGRATILVSATGMKTRFGKISAEMASIDESETPLEKQLSVLGRYLGIGAILCCLLVFAVGEIKGAEFFPLFLTAISLAVAAVPESLPAVVTITLGLGVSKMAQKKAIIRKLSAVETLGATMIICTDKTGTLTTNSMRVREVWGLGGEWDVNGDTSRESDQFGELMRAGVLCNSSTLSMNDEGVEVVIGDTTEGALLYLAKQAGVSYDAVRDEYSREEEFLFDSIRKMMSVVVADNRQKTTDNRFLIYTKGAPEMVVDKCVLSESDKQRVHMQIEAMAKKGLRTLGLGCKEVAGIDPEKLRLEDVESGLTFLGVVGIADPPRPVVKDAIATAREAGVRTVMITGDNVITAGAIGQEIGLLTEGDIVLNGEEVRKLSDEELEVQLLKVRIFARSTPEDKLRIVRLFQKQGNVVAVTGDGVNDSLALKQADIGVAMGINGTDVAKEAADMVLSDDNYATIVVAVEEGRRIYRNIVKAVHYLVSTNIGEIFTILGAMLLFDAGHTPFTPLMILWMNLVTDGLPALALATDTLEKDTMKNPPRAIHAQIIQRSDWGLLLLNALFLASASLGLFYLGNSIGGVVMGRTYAFVAIVGLQFVRVLTVRRSSPFNNLKLLAVLGVSLGLQLFVVWWEPTKELFGLV